jgi:hypothetical protein
VSPNKLTYEIDVEPGGKLQLPKPLLDGVGPGHWIITVERSESRGSESERDHTAFLNGYAPEDEGLYDDYPTR